MKHSAFNYTWLCFLALFLSACGGGGEDADLELPGTSQYSLTLAASPSSTTSDSSPVSLTGTLRDPGGAAVSGATLTFTSDVGRLAAAVAQTDGAGRATVVLFAGSDGIGSGSATVRFTDPGRNVAVAMLDVMTVGDEAAVSEDPDAPPAASSPTLSLTMVTGSGTVVDAASPVTDTSPGTLRATVRAADGSPIPGIVVTFGVAPIASLAQSTALTNASGVAEVSVVAVSAGAGNATASASVNETVLTKDVVFATAIGGGASVQQGLALGLLSGGSFTSGILGSDTAGAIASGSVVTIAADVVDEGSGLPYAQSVGVTFRSDCASNGKATIDSTVNTVGGRATAAYRPSGCVGTDTVTAEVRTATQTLTATVNLTMAAEGVASISFESVTSDAIALKGSGGTARPETADLTFKVVGQQGNPLPSQVVCFELSTKAGGIDVSPVKASTNNEGMVLTTVTAGTVPTPVRVGAFVDDNNDCSDKPSPLVQTVSGVLTVSTGLPHQNSFSLAVLEPTNAKPAFDWDGVEWDVTVFAADRFHNPVAEDTAISFWTSLGAIEPSCTTDVGGSCAVKWRSQAPRTASATIGRPGRATILAYAVGEESFTDANANGRFDTGETIAAQLGEVIKDTARNDVLDAGEEFLDFNGNGAYDGPNSKFDGVLCGTSTTAADCTGEASVHVRGYNEIVLSTNRARIYVVHPDADLSGMSFVLGGVDNVLLAGISNPAAANYEYSGQTISKIYVGTAAALRAGRVRVLATDSNGNQLAPGTKIKLGVVPSGGATVDTEAGEDQYTLTRISGEDDWFDRLFFLKPPAAATGDAILRVTVTHTDGKEEIFDLSVIDTQTP